MSCLLLFPLWRVKCQLTIFITVRMNLWAASAPWYCTMSASATTRVSTVYSLVRRIAFLRSRQSLVAFTFFCLFFSERSKCLLRLADHNKTLPAFSTNTLVCIQVVSTIKLKCSWLVKEEVALQVCLCLWVQRAADDVKRGKRMGKNIGSGKKQLTNSNKNVTENLNLPSSRPKDWCINNLSSSKLKGELCFTGRRPKQLRHDQRRNEVQIWIQTFSLHCSYKIVFMPSIAKRKKQMK